MMRLLRDVRMIPIVLVATVSLFTLKTMGLIFDGGYTISTERPQETVIVRNDTGAAPQPEASQQRSWAQDMFGYPSGEAARGSAPRPSLLAQNAADAPDITGSVTAAKEPPAAKNAPKGASPPPSTAGVVSLDPARTTSTAERAILQRLQERRGELEARERELDMRESLLKATEKRLETRVEELKAVETRINETLQRKDEADAARFKSLVSMYENMKAKEAARIFDRLDLKILLDVTSQINPRRMSDILAQMSPDAAERLTVELANRLSGNKTAAATPAATLPKIEGKPAK